VNDNKLAYSAKPVPFRLQTVCRRREARLSGALTAAPPVSARLQPDGLEAAFLANRARLLRFLEVRGAGADAEDVLHEVWLKIGSRPTGPIGAPLSYLFRAADMAMIDRYRSARQAAKRDADWSEAAAGNLPGRSDQPSADRVIVGREHALMVSAALDELGARPAAIFRRHRIDGVPQRAVAEEFGVSLSTVESDLRLAYRAVLAVKERIDEA
jgi:RNA polymerase sigma-70 factor (ECF subfamily)